MSVSFTHKGKIRCGQGLIPGSGMAGNNLFSLFLEPGHDLLLNLPLHWIEEEARVLQAAVDGARQT